MNQEPSLKNIDDYNNKESKEKRNTVRIVVLFCLAVGIVYAIAKYNYSDTTDYIGTKEQPGIHLPNN